MTYPTVEVLHKCIWYYHACHWAACVTMDSTTGVAIF